MTEASGDLRSRVEKVIEEDVRPALAMDGGDIELLDIEDDVVVVRLQGACQGCPAAGMTLQYGVQNMLMRKIPEVKGVRSA